jgi:hypothetical protein
MTKITNKKETWELLKKKSDDGSYFMGVGADGETEKSIEGTGLLSGHAYAVLQMVEYKNHKLVF